MSAADSKNKLINSLFRTIAPIVVFILLIAVISDLHANWDGFKIKEVEAARFLSSPLPGSTIDTAWRNINSDVNVSGKIYQFGNTTDTDGLIFMRNNIKIGSIGTSTDNRVSFYTGNNTNPDLTIRSGARTSTQKYEVEAGQNNNNPTFGNIIDTLNKTYYWDLSSDYGLRILNRSNQLFGYLSSSGSGFGLKSTNTADRVTVNNTGTYLQGQTFVWGEQTAGGYPNNYGGRAWLNFGSWNNISLPDAADGALYRFNNQAEIMVDDNLYLRDYNTNTTPIQFNTDAAAVSVVGGEGSFRLNNNIGNTYSMIIGTNGTYGSNAYTGDLLIGRGVPGAFSETLRLDSIGRSYFANRIFPSEWIQFNNHTGLYSPINGAHLYPNNGSYGSWRIAGSRNGWYGLEFDTAAGQVSLMMGHSSQGWCGQDVGIHNNTYGWMFRVNCKTLYVDNYVDNNDNNFNLDPNGTSRVYQMNTSFINDKVNDSWFPYYNGANYFRGTTYAFGHIWYDESNTGYYLDPNGTSRFNNLVMDTLSASWLKGGNVTVGGNNNGSDRQCAGCADSITGMPNLWLVAGHSSQGNGGFGDGINGQIVFRDANCPGPAGDGYGNCQVGYDVAELYQSTEQLEPGDIVSSSDQRSHVQAANQSDARSTIGVISTRPAILIDGSGFITGLVPTVDNVNASANLDQKQKDAWMQLALNGKDKYPVALAGRVPVKVIYTNSDITFGDKITVSKFKGIGQKAQTSSVSVGTVLSEFKKDNSGNIVGYQCQTADSIESIQWPDISTIDDWSGIEKSCFKLPDGTFVGKVMVFVNTSTFDPEVYMTSTQGYTLEQSIQNGQSLYSVKDQNNNLVSRIMSLAELIVGKIRAGVIETKQLIVDGVDVMKKLNELNQKVDNQEKELNELKQRLQQLEQQ